MKFAFSIIALILCANICFAQGKFGGGDGDGYAQESFVHYTIVSSPPPPPPPTGIDELAGSGIQAFPNPTSGLLHLSKRTNWQLISPTGTMIQEGRGNQIDMQAYNAGLYFIRLDKSVTSVVKMH